MKHELNLQIILMKDLWSKLSIINPLKMKDNRNSRPYYKNNQLLLYREITFVCSDVDTKHTNTLCGQNVDRGRSKKPFMSGVVEGEKEVFRLRPLVLLTGEV